MIWTVIRMTNEEQKITQDIEPVKRCKPKYMPLPSDNLDDFEIVGDIEAGQAIKASIRYFKSVVAGSPQDDILESIESITAKMIFNHMRLNIDRALKEYFTNHTNGKKGGAPKGNQNARKKKKPQPEQEPEEAAEDLTDEAEPVPDPDPEPDREPEPKPFAILKPIERRAAEIVLHENDYDFLDRFDTKQLDELFTLAALSGSGPGELATAAQDADSVLNAARKNAAASYKSRNEERWFNPEYGFILDKLDEMRQIPREELETACKEYDERTRTA